MESPKCLKEPRCSTWQIKMREMITNIESLIKLPIKYWRTLDHSSVGGTLFIDVSTTRAWNFKRSLRREAIDLQTHGNLSHRKKLLMSLETSRFL